MKKFSFLVVMLATCITLQAESYGIVVNGTTYFAGTLNTGNTSFTEYMVLGVPLKSGDYFQLYDKENAEAWAVALDGASTTGVAPSSDLYYCTADGCYDFYIKLEYNGTADQLYVGVATGGCSGNIGEDIGNIIYYDFDDANLTAAVTFLGDYPGKYNAYTGDVVIPATVTYGGNTYSVTCIRQYAFYGCSGLTSVTIPNSVTSIEYEAFCGCSGLTSVTIPNSVTSIGGAAFAECSGLTSVTIPNSVTSIGEDAFYGTAWLANQPDGVIYINQSLNTYKGEMPANTSIVVRDGTTQICDYAFSGCSGLTSVTIPNSVTSIGRSAFRGCIGLTSVTIGNSVTSIGYEAFSGCTKLINIVCYAAEPPSCEESVFANYNVFLKVPCNNLMAYQTHVCWGSFKYISCIGSEEVQVTEFSVTPSTNEALFTWPAESNAATYELVISKDGVVFCTLTFNASGQLMGIAFAPGANTAATTATSGFQFTVTGLAEASHYTYTFDAKDAGGSVVKHYAGEFNTDGSVGLGQIELAGLYTQAGRIVCEGEFRIYDLLGRDVTRLNGSLSGVYVVKTANAAQKVIVK